MADLGQEQHDLICRLKEIALELGRSPKRSELIGRSGITPHRIERAFGSFVIAMKAAGLETVREERKRKLTNEIFQVDLADHLTGEIARQEEPRYSNFVLPAENYPSTAVLGDFHAPFQHHAATQFAIDVISVKKPKRVVQMGDLRDMFSAQKYPRSHNLFTPKEEIDAGTKACTELWAKIREAVPGVECFQLLGNHDVRPYKRVLEACPELEMFIDLTPLYTFPGVKLTVDPREELELDGVFFHHGYITKLGGNRDFMNACSVTGHSHRAGVAFRTIWGGHQIWELNAGTLGDPQSKGLSYTPQKHHHQTLGLGWIDRFGPRFIPWQPKQK